MALESPYNPGTYLFHLPLSYSPNNPKNFQQIFRKNSNKLQENQLIDNPFHQNSVFSNISKHIEPLSSSRSQYASPKISRLSSNKSSSLSQPQGKISNWINILLDRTQKPVKQHLNLQHSEQSQHKEGLTNSIIRSSRLQMKEGIADSWGLPKNLKKLKIIEDIHKNQQNDNEINTIQPQKNESLVRSKKNIVFERDENIEEISKNKLSKEKENKNTHIPPNLKRRLQIYQSLFKTSNNGFVDYLENQSQYQKKLNLNETEGTYVNSTNNIKNVEIEQKNENLSKNFVISTKKLGKIRLLEFKSSQRKESKNSEQLLPSKNLNIQEELMTSVNSKELMKLPKCDVATESQEIQEYDDDELNCYETFNEKMKKQSIGIAESFVSKKEQKQSNSKNINGYSNLNQPQLILMAYENQRQSHYNSHKRTVSLESSKKPLQFSQIFKLPKITNNSGIKTNSTVIVSESRQSSNEGNTNNVFKSLDPWEQQDNQSDCSFTENTKDTLKTIF